jgi:hypothetical protein
LGVFFVHLVVGEDLQRRQAVFISGKQQVFSGNMRRLQSRQIIQPLPLQIPFRRHRSAAEDMLVKQGKLFPVFRDEVGVDITDVHKIQLLAAQLIRFKPVSPLLSV